MKKMFFATIALMALGAIAPAHANLALAKAKNCMTCHAVDKKLVGPAYKDVAAKYANEKGAEERLAEKIVKGSQGVWGAIPMPPNTQVTGAEAHTLARWILGGAKADAK